MVERNWRNASPQDGEKDQAEMRRQRRPKQDDELVLISAADIEPENIVWLWRHWLHCGVFNLLAGQSTAGKSTIALSWCATITSGGPWPDGQAAGEPARAVYWSGEDGIKDTLMPRFLAAGGERSMMHFIEGVRGGGRKRPFDPASDMPKLTHAVQRLMDVRLIVLDPVVNMVKGDSHKNVETRIGLQPFADLCAQTGACGLGITHFTKNTAGGTPLDRVTGSLAFHALPRCVLVAARDQNGGRDARRALMRAKVSNGPDWGGFDYKLDQRPLDDFPEIEAQSVLWGEAVEGSARDILGQFEAKPPSPRQGEAALFLMAALANGPRLAAEVIAEATKVGIAEKTLRNAFRYKLGGVFQRAGYRGPVIWELPKGAAQ
jgi:putative DNA primase/helicase